MDSPDREPSPRKRRPGDVSNHPPPQSTPYSSASLSSSMQGNPPQLVEGSRVRFPASSGPSSAHVQIPLRRLEELRHQTPLGVALPQAQREELLVPRRSDVMWPRVNPSSIVRPASPEQFYQLPKMNIGPTLPPVVQNEPKATLTVSQLEAIHQILAHPKEIPARASSQLQRAIQSMGPNDAIQINHYNDQEENLDCGKAPPPFGKRKVDMKLQAIQNDRLYANYDYEKKKEKGAVGRDGNREVQFLTKGSSQPMHYNLLRRELAPFDRQLQPRTYQPPPCSERTDCARSLEIAKRLLAKGDPARAIEQVAKTRLVDPLPLPKKEKGTSTFFDEMEEEAEREGLIPPPRMRHRSADDIESFGPFNPKLPYDASFLTQEDLEHRKLPPHTHEEAKKDIRSWYRLKHGQPMVDIGGIRSMNEDEEMSSDEEEEMDLNPVRTNDPIEVSSSVPVTVTANFSGTNVAASLLPSMGLTPSRMRITSIPPTMNSPHPGPGDSFACTNLTFTDQPPAPASGISFVMPPHAQVPETEHLMGPENFIIESVPNPRRSPQKGVSSRPSSRQSSIPSPLKGSKDKELVVTIAPPPPARPPDPFPEAGNEIEDPEEVETASQSSQESQASQRSRRSVRRSLLPTGEENIMDDATSFHNLITMDQHPSETPMEQQEDPGTPTQDEAVGRCVSGSHCSRNQSIHYWTGLDQISQKGCQLSGSGNAPQKCGPSYATCWIDQPDS